MLLQQIWSDSRTKVAVLLVLLLILSLLIFQRPIYVLHALIALSVTVAIDFMLTYIRFKILDLPLSAIVSGLLIALIASPTAGWLATVVAVLVAVLTKHFIIPVSHKHIFNPAAVGIVVSSLLFREPVAWWGVSWGVWPAIIIALWMSPVLWRLHRFWHPVLFLLGYAMTILWLVPSAWRLIFDGTVFLFAFVMLPEPMTSLARGFWQYGWGVMVGLLVASLVFLKIDIGDPLLLSLLLANMLGFIFVRV